MFHFATLEQFELPGFLQPWSDQIVERAIFRVCPCPFVPNLSGPWGPFRAGVCVFGCAMPQGFVFNLVGVLFWALWAFLLCRQVVRVA